MLNLCRKDEASRKRQRRQSATEVTATSHAVEDADAETGGGDHHDTWGNDVGNTRVVGVVYHADMRRHSTTLIRNADECPRRISSIYDFLTTKGILSRCRVFPSRRATRDEVLRVHSEAFFANLESTQLKAAELDGNAEVYYKQYTADSAFLAAESLIELVEHTIKGACDSGVAIIRPPGHHASQESSAGFCIVNNVAIAAKMALEKHAVKRLLILDWDVHHGNGIQEIFYEDNRVLYCSLHRYENGLFYPGSTAANFTAVGKGAGEGYNVNIPWDRPGFGDAEYLEAFKQVISPIAKKYSPELIIIAAGFDSAAGDPMGGMTITPWGYATITQSLNSLAPVVLALEGGYNIDTMRECVASCTLALLGDPIPKMPDHPVDANALQTIRAVRCLFSKYFNFYDTLEVKLSIPSLGMKRDEHLLKENGNRASVSNESSHPLNSIEPSVMDTVDDIIPEVHDIDANVNNALEVPTKLDKESHGPVSVSCTACGTRFDANKEDTFRYIKEAIQYVKEYRSRRGDKATIGDIAENTFWTDFYSSKKTPESPLAIKYKGLRLYQDQKKKLVVDRICKSLVDEGVAKASISEYLDRVQASFKTRNLKFIELLREKYCED